MHKTKGWQFRTINKMVAPLSGISEGGKIIFTFIRKERKREDFAINPLGMNSTKGKKEGKKGWKEGS